MVLLYFSSEVATNWSPTVLQPCVWAKYQVYFASDFSHQGKLPELGVARFEKQLKENSLQVLAYRNISCSLIA